ncbi:hypothetical protein GGX14DRAFT_630132 [Mycena pura]|uniref:HMG box domain-containing protein n=1 Tax=Mycena pura TaxID=153505 RepID=A0AAD6YRZ7_9AGAR|nr:hypothetical protein GGX14DRAFT_630132 [Mycena pura]
MDLNGNWATDDFYRRALELLTRVPVTKTKTATKDANAKTRTKKTGADGEEKKKRAPSAYNIFVKVAALWREAPENPKRGEIVAERPAKKKKEPKAKASKPKAKLSRSADSAPRSVHPVLHGLDRVGEGGGLVRVGGGGKALPGVLARTQQLSVFWKSRWPN